jgi:hypothetical protein
MQKENGMPNWCDNTVTISHEDPAKIAALAEAMREGKFCDHVIPVPEDLKITAGFLGDGEEQRKLEEATARNVEKYGAGNWYDFCVNRWGTKWDVSCEGGVEVSEDGKTVNASFDSAWSPPTGVYDELVEQGYEVVGYYYEPGMGYVGKFDNGVDDCFDYSGHDSTTVRDHIGEELDDCFGISENMAEWEAENEEADELVEFLEEGAEAKGLNKPDTIKFD